MVLAILSILAFLLWPRKKDTPPPQNPPPQETIKNDTDGGTDNNQGGGADENQNQGTGENDGVDKTTKVYTTTITITLEDYSKVSYVVKTKKYVEVPTEYTAELSNPKYYPKDQWVQIWTPDKKTLLFQCLFIEAVPENQ